MADDYRYHIDHHGSLVRPAELLAARARADQAALAAAEEAAVASIAHAQRRLTVSAVSDGQFRRAHFESVVYDSVAGFEPVAGGQPLADLAGIPPVRRRSAPATPFALGRLAQAEAAPVLAIVDRPVFVALPSPGYLAALGVPLQTSSDVDSMRARGHALAAIIRAEIQSLAAEGVAYVPLGNPLYTPLLTVAGRERLAPWLPVDAVLEAMVQCDRAVFGGLTLPETFRVGLDLTDSGPLLTTERGYDARALESLLLDTPYHRLCVDFPVDHASRIPLDHIKPGLVISLGAIDVSNPEPEDVQQVLRRLDPIFEKRGEQELAVATNGGFASSADRPTMDEEQQHAKLRLIETVARYYWGNEI